MSKLYNGQEDWEDNIVQSMTRRLIKGIEDKNDKDFMTAIEERPTPVSPYHAIRLATHGKTAPFINMPLGQTRVYVERIG